MHLTSKQLKFCEIYDGDGLKAAIAAGYSAKNAYQTSHRLLNNAKIVEEIRKRDEKPRLKRIMSREERQEFWTKVALGEETGCDMRDRLKASELLGKSECDFITKTEISGGLTVKRTRKRYDGGTD